MSLELISSNIHTVSLSYSSTIADYYLSKRGLKKKELLLPYSSLDQNIKWSEKKAPFAKNQAKSVCSKILLNIISNYQLNPQKPNLKKKYICILPYKEGKESLYLEKIFTPFLAPFFNPAIRLRKAKIMKKDCFVDSSSILVSA